MGDWRARVRRTAYDAVVVGSGPNGLAAAHTLAAAGRSVLVLEAADTPGGGARSAEVTRPGFRHDVCSAIHPLGVGSPFFRGLGLTAAEVEWIHSPLVVAHPFDDGSAAAISRSVDETARGLGEDGPAWRRLFGPLAADWDALSGDLLGPLLRWPRHPFKMLRFARHGVLSARHLAESMFRTSHARSLLAGLAAHSMLPLGDACTASFGLVLGTTAHALGWPLARGGSQAIVDALLGRLRALGVEVVTGARVDHLDDLPSARRVLLDLTPRQVLAVAGDRLRGRFSHRGLVHWRLAIVGPMDCPWTSTSASAAPLRTDTGYRGEKTNRGDNFKRPRSCYANRID